MMHFRQFAFAGAALVTSFAFAPSAQAMTKIERVVSPGGIEAWLVREPSVPLVAMEFSFKGGANQDPSDKPGVSYMTAATLDEGAGDLDAKAFQQRLERNAIELSFRASRDELRGTLKVMTNKQDEGYDLLRQSLTAPRFDAEPVERVRAQMLTALKRETTSPNDISARLWWRTAFPGHPYSQPTNGSLDSVPVIVRDDLKAYAGRVLARDNLKIGVVGDIDAKQLGVVLDRVFGGLPAKADLRKLPEAKMQSIGKKLEVELDVPQTVVSFGGLGVPRKDPDFIPAYIVNHILGGGSFSSRLYNEVREKRGLAYSVYSYLLPLDATALFMGATQTRADRANETVGLIEQEIKRLAENGPTQDELDKSKSYLRGSYALNFDTSTKIAAQLVQLQVDDLGIDYWERRNGLIEAVTLDDVKRVAKRLLDGGVLVTMVGRAPVIPAKGG
ncbi:M16 family metallopeptidase [Pseudorhodoplanes sinuspersici]|uniref:Peptidase M16 n=1 Tax=Pseudorhodoplanes sinuspersici TaxID=1235591 RepID=A0A1W6ZRJ9_9HYPH|nr:pitrilysin family protein [Pseudorhodoplanes sinuspersici]ARP99952.1 peptidase M16 [Pseudorhodoplanes sinuspersici]RKE70977.1 zinc protease [Pseudorhodoplanes sinuspersici]